MRIRKVPKMRKGRGSFINRRTKTGKKFYDRFFIYVPTEVARNGTFPFKEGDKVIIKVQGNKLVIEKG